MNIPPISKSEEYPEEREEKLYFRRYDLAVCNSEGRVVMPIEIISAQKCSESQLTGYGFYESAINWARDKGAPWVCILTRFSIELIQLVEPINNSNFHHFPTNDIVKFYISDPSRQINDPGIVEITFRYWLQELIGESNSNLPFLERIQSLGLLDLIRGGFVVAEPEI